MSEPLGSDELIRIIRYQVDKTMEGPAIEVTEWLIDTLPDLEDVDEDEIGLIKLPDSRTVDIEWNVKVSPIRP